ncbi:MAG: HINT domain-containing protein [Planctomycetota bacterium]|nr:HINT domain-containing protein [Planctomycetota bacterium]
MQSNRGREVGERLSLTTGPATVTAVRVEVLSEPVRVYNFQVADWHTYYAAPEADKPFVWVHNANYAEIEIRRNVEKHNSDLDIRDYTRKKRALNRHQEEHGAFTYSPDTGDVRIAEAQSAYRKAVGERYKRRFGKDLDMSRLDADHPVDMIAGGHPGQALKMRSSGINRSIGSQITRRTEALGLNPGDKFRIRFGN